MSDFRIETRETTAVNGRVELPDGSLAFEVHPSTDPNKVRVTALVPADE